MCFENEKRLLFLLEKSFLRTFIKIYSLELSIEGKFIHQNEERDNQIRINFNHVCYYVEFMRKIGNSMCITRLYAQTKHMTLNITFMRDFYQFLRHFDSMELNFARFYRFMGIIAGWK